MVVFDSAAIYLDTCKTNKEKIVAIDAIINALMITATKAAANDNITEYALDDGQTKIRTMYRGTAAIFESINAFEKLKQMYIQRINGRMVRLVDGKNFIGRNNAR